MMKRIFNIILFILICSIKILGQDASAVSNYYKALNYYQNKNDKSALEQLESCNEDIKCIEFTGKIYFKNKDYVKAISIFKSLLEKEPAEASFYLSLIFADMGFADESILWLEKYFEYKNPRFYSRIISNKEFDNIAKTSEWREFWKTERYPKNYEQFEEAEYKVRSENYTDAINILNNIQGSSSDYYKNYLTALSYFNLGNYQEANKFVDISINEKQKFIDAYKLKYKISINNKDYNSAYNSVNTLLKIDEYDPVHLLEKAEVLNLSSKFEEAEKYINEYTGYFPDNENALLLKAHIFINNKKNFDALLVLNSLIDKNPSVTEYFLLRADINYNFKSWDIAKKDYSMALDINPDQPEAYFKLGMCYYNQGAMKKACYNWNKAAQMKHREATRMLYDYCGY